MTSIFELQRCLMFGWKSNKYITMIFLQEKNIRIIGNGVRIEIHITGSPDPGTAFDNPVFLLVPIFKANIIMNPIIILSTTVQALGDKTDYDRVHTFLTFELNHVAQFRLVLWCLLKNDR